MSALGPAITLFFSLLSFEPPQWVQGWRGDEIRYSERGEWIKHTVRSRENLVDIAVRYQVDVNHLKKWNHLGSGRLRVGKKLKVRAKRLAFPKEAVQYLVRQGDTWGSIAANYAVASRDLHAWNYKVRHLEPDITLKLWFDPSLYWTVGRELGPLPNLNEVPAGSLSSGKPQKGRLIEGISLPPTDAVTCRSERLCYGSSHTLQAIAQAFGNLRYETGYKGEVIIGAISRKHGRKFPPHKSHQSGRDADIRLPVLPGVPTWREPDVDEVDWMATWAMIEALVDTGRVQTIFLESDLQRPLYEAARRMGRSHDQLGPLITYPREHGKGMAVVRHSKGHDAHIHVRFTCADDEAKCRK